MKYPNNRLMSNIIYLLFLIIFLNNCSFDNKTGIWTGSDQVVKKNKEDINQNIEFIFKKQSNIIKKKELSVDEPLEIDEPTSYYEWSQSYQNKFNYINNVSFSNNGNYKKLSKIHFKEKGSKLVEYVILFVCMVVLLVVGFVILVTQVLMEIITKKNYQKIVNLLKNFWQKLNQN